MSEVTFVVPRDSQDEVTVAIVRATLTEEGEKQGLARAATFLLYLKNAVTRWVQETDEGRDAWRRSSHDLNVGDLAAFGDMVEIEKRFGMPRLVRMLSVEAYSCAAPGQWPWRFDTVLVDKEQLHG